ncbi:MAG: hypothetical protein KY460_15680 [Actinobacteria bacterium]|nr:hypothetical protein [Actinomycetota bacterium]
MHQTALYDFLLGGVVFAALLFLEQRPRFDGFFVAAFVVCTALDASSPTSRALPTRTSWAP